MNKVLTPTKWEWKDNPGAGIQLYANVPFSADCVEFKTRPYYPQRVYELHISKDGDVFKDKNLERQMVLGYEQWVQFSPKDWDEMQKQNAQLLVTCANSCLSVNPSNPQVVAESIEEMYDALRHILPECTGYMESMNWADYNMAVKDIRQLLEKLEAKS